MILGYAIIEQFINIILLKYFIIKKQFFWVTIPRFKITKNDFTYRVEHLKLHIFTKFELYSLITSLVIFATRKGLTKNKILRKLLSKFANANQDLLL